MQKQIVGENMKQNGMVKTNRDDADTKMWLKCKQGTYGSNKDDHTRVGK